MLWPLQWLILFLARLLLGLRYRVEIRGIDASLAKPGPYLVLPNHPSYMDPPNLIAQLWPTFHFRPLVLETNFESPVLAPLAWILKAIKVPNVEVASLEARQRAEESIQEVIRTLQAGQNVALWPSGHLMRDGLEHLGGARTLSDVLTAVPNVTLVLARTRGMWGSMFSKAAAPKIPGVLALMIQGMWIHLSNLIVFTPRRRLTITLEAFEPAQHPSLERGELNRWLENWYNADTNLEPEKPTFVPYHFWFGPRTFEYPPTRPLVTVSPQSISAKTKQTITDMFAAKLKRPFPSEQQTPEATFIELGIDSLDAMELTLEVEQHFGFQSTVMPSTMGQIWALAEGKLDGGDQAKPAPPTWFQPPKLQEGISILGATVPEAFVKRAIHSGKDVAVADDLAGVLTYERLFVGARVMSKRIAAFDEPNIGLLLPASVGGDLALLALHLAGKLPVLLNWTTGPGNLSHAVQLMGLKRVLTSKKFIDRTHLTVPGAELVFLEDLRMTIGKVELLRTLLQLRWFPSWAQSTALQHTQPDPDQPAVVLFTSGSEKAPKAVPLTHRNVLSNMQGIIDLLRISRENSVFGFLPLFHSFGHTVTGLFPILCGLKVVRHPDPTDASGLARKIASYKPTVMAGTPTFLNAILERAKPGDLDTLQIMVVGAEKCPEAVFEKAKRLAPNGVIIEGYGITECGPIVSGNPPSAVKQGTIGPPLPNVKVRILDLENHQLLPNNQMGLLQVCAPSVFPGYLGHDGDQPFDTVDNERWYHTGDLCTLDDDGYLHFNGRLKRFIKAGGEMISLPALEEPFAVRYMATEEGPKVAVEGVEMSEGRKIVLFTTEDITLQDANAILQAEGFRGVMRLDEVQRIERIPILGTGKTDYKVLRNLIQM